MGKQLYTKFMQVTSHTLVNGQTKAFSAKLMTYYTNKYKKTKKYNATKIKVTMKGGQSYWGPKEFICS